MLTLRKAGDRGHFDHGWLDTFHTFSFAAYQNAQWTRFRSLRVLNEDRVSPDHGFGTHGHSEMEIVTVVVSGTLAHKDSAGGRGELPRGGVQAMSAGVGLTHSEFNPSKDEPVHFVQIWLLPDEPGGRPTYGDGRVEDADRTGLLLPLVTGTGQSARLAGSGPGLKIRADAAVLSGLLPAGTEVVHEFDAHNGEPRHGWVQVISGTVTVNGAHLTAGDGVGLTDEAVMHLTATEDAEVLAFDLA
ncbi:pirin family protein [Alienimonas californiensis]|uniref:Quercetin 2,3-dioxygenase n=1 Tax=Alienimonas californiensis TaxID=2527989 RepID=A0A517PE17_9PLAN|nr:pirin family protein [Alienimonas californiensis]QDT17591.1 Quercetin 2,3-dioxygenase [Alienimonas californiensis]